MSDSPRESEVVIHWSRPWREWALAAFFLAGAIGCGFASSASGNGWPVFAAISLIFVALVGVLVWAAMRKRRERMGRGEPAMRLDREGFSLVSDFWTTSRPGRFRIPWSEVEACRAAHDEGEVGRHLEIQLRDPLATYRVPPRTPGRFSGRRGRLKIQEIWFDHSADQLADLFQTYLERAPDRVA